MTVPEKNNILAEFIGLKLKSDGKTWELDFRFKDICNYKTTSSLKFNSSLDWLNIALDKVSKIKDLFITTTFSEGKCYCYLYYKAKEIEGEYRNASFSTSREKLLKEYNLALFEVISNFVLWLKSNPEAERDLEYETKYIVLNEDNSNTVYLERKENNIDSYPRENVQEIN